MPKTLMPKSLPLKTKIFIFTDGASRGNPGPGGFGAIVALVTPGGTVTELGGRDEYTTNNRMELTAALQALEFLKSSKLSSLELVIFSDSSYLINGITTWVKDWQKRDWKTATKKEVENRDLWKPLSLLVESFEKTSSISWLHVKGHAGVEGNERADQIATAFADNKPIELFSGKQENYIFVPDGRFAKEPIHSKSREKKNRSRAKAHAYISLVGGKIMIHKTWAQCEARVKGMSGAKFKKALSAEDEKNIIAELSR